MTNPCKDCEKRVMGCHATCETYLSWHETHTKNRKPQHHDATDFLIDNMLKSKRRVNRR